MYKFCLVPFLTNVSRLLSRSLFSTNTPTFYASRVVSFGKLENYAHFFVPNTLCVFRKFVIKNFSFNETTSAR